jgi:hypothetical protein
MRKLKATSKIGTTVNSAFEKKLYVKAIVRSGGKCSLCPPNKGCNGKSRPKHGTKKPKKKDHR